MTSIRIIQVWIKILAFIAILLLAASAQADAAIPALKSHVTDLTATLSVQEVARLEEKLAAFEKKKGSQVALLMVSTTQPETIEQYAIRVAEAWKLGREGIDDGVLLLIAKNDRTLRIEVGYGLEGVLPDAKAKRIIEEIIVPQFKAGNFTGGIDAGIETILRVIAGEPLPPPVKHGAGPSSSINSLSGSFIPLLIGLIIVGRLLQTLLGRLAGATATSIGAGFIGWLLFSSIITALLVAAFAFFISLFQHIGPGVYRNSRGNWPGNSHWGGGMGGGGFGGGGGGFGGGGASGRW